MTILVEVLTRVTELVRIEAKAKGISSFEGLIRARWARPKTRGIKNAVEAVLLIKAHIVAEATRITPSSRLGSSPVKRRIARPQISTTPVRTRAAVRINKPRIIITVLLPKPAKAVSAGIKPVRIKESATPKPTA